MNETGTSTLRLRTESERFDMITEAASFIGVGIEQKRQASEVVDQLRGYRREGQSQDAFKKEIERLCKRIAQESADGETNSGLLRLAVNGLPTYYYWSDTDDKYNYVEKFTITTPRAFALNFVRQHIAAILPKSLFSQLEEDFLLAENKLKHQGINLPDVLDFSPFGISITGNSVKPHTFDTEAVNLVFEAIVKHNVIQFAYDSIHSGYTGTTLISPQKLRFLSGQIQVLGFVHADSRLKHFALQKMKEVSTVKGKPFHKVKLAKYQNQRTLVVRCHTWVKDILTESHPGASWQAKKITPSIWQLSVGITIPKHFQKDEDDCFYIANYLSMFGDSILILAPSSVQQEMNRRSSKMAQLYNDNTPDESALSILTQSPFEISHSSQKT